MTAGHFFDAAGGVYQDLVGLIQEDAVVDDAGDIVELAGELGGVAVFELDIDDEAAVVGEEEVAVEGAADDAVEGDVAQAGADAGQAESQDGDGERDALTEAIDEFGFVDDVDAFARGSGDHALADDGAAGALDHAHLGIDFIRAVEEIVDVLEHGEVHQLKLLGAGEGFGGVAGGHALDFEVFGADTFGEGEDAAGCGAPRAKAHDHP